MLKENLNIIPTGSRRLLQDLKGKEDSLRKILGSEEIKKKFLEAAKQQTDSFSPQEKFEFLEGAIFFLAQPETKYATSRAIIYMLRNTDLTSVNQKEMYGSYLATFEFVSENIKMHPYSPKKIDFLLQAGKIITPSFKDRKKTFDALSHLSKSFPEHIRENILHKIEEAKQPPTPSTPVKSPGPDLDVFDAAVGVLEIDYTNHQIAQKYNVSVETVKRSVRRNRLRGICRKPGRGKYGIPSHLRT